MFVRWKTFETLSHRSYGTHGDFACQHREDGGRSLAPALVETYREGKRVRHRRVWQPGPAVRPCCLDDPNNVGYRCWFWEEVSRRFEALQANPKTAARAEEILDQRERIEKALEKEVPKLTPSERVLLECYWRARGMGCFTASAQAAWWLEARKLWDGWRLHALPGESFEDFTRRETSEVEARRRAARQRAEKEARARESARRPHGRETYTRTPLPNLRPDGLLAPILRDLGVGWPCSIGDMKRAWRSGAKRYHPDQDRKNPKAHQTFIDFRHEHGDATDQLTRYWIAVGASNACSA